MRLLIDSHVMLWLLYEPERLSRSVRSAIEKADEVSVSLVSLWELAIKYGKGRLVYSPGQLTMGIGEAGFTELPVAHRHILKLPFVSLAHRDPFDTMLVAQAMSENLTLVTADRALLASEYPTLDARR